MTYLSTTKAGSAYYSEDITRPHADLYPQGGENTIHLSSTLAAQLNLTICDTVIVADKPGAGGRELALCGMACPE